MENKLLLKLQPYLIKSNPTVLINQDMHDYLIIAFSIMT
jgi:hypothetical protein